DKNFTRMGDVTGSGVINEVVNGVTVGKQEPQPALAKGQKRLVELVQQH
ncbi:MAG TPA: sugar ABC transporter substrate-binding protein, partial [Franconibacter pulveris]|nr:sugar ABC transporter substrate-binding protein [Franconibacter pulveris]